MGSVIRRVPPNWEHPTYTEENKTLYSRVDEYMPMRDRTIEQELSDREDERFLWENNVHPHQSISLSETFDEYAGGDPDPLYYRPAYDEPASWWQVYENVSEGTPVTPPFETKEELIDFLCTYGEFDDLPSEIPSREKAAAFVEEGYVSSFLFTNGRLYRGINSMGK